MPLWGGQIIDNNFSVGQFDCVDGYPKEEWDRDSFRAVIKVRVPFSQRIAEAFKFRGGVTAFGDRVRPMRYTPFPLAVCTRVGMDPVGVIQDLGQPTSPDPWNYEEAILTATFETVPWEGEGQPPEMINVEEDFEGSAEMLTLPFTDLYWDASQQEKLKAGDIPVRLERTGTWRITLNNIDQTVPELLSFVGHTNLLPLVSTKYGVTFEAETLLWQMPTPRTVPTAENKRGFTMELGLGWQPEGWNKLWKPGTQPGAPTATRSPIYDAQGNQWRGFKTKDFGTVLTMFVPSP